MRDIHRHLKYICVLAASGTVISSCGTQEESGQNQLDMGFDSKAPESVTLQLSGLMNYSGKTSEELLALRSKKVQEHPELLKGSYEPSSKLFAFDGSSPWWGTRGYLFRGSGGAVDSTDGVSRESKFFGNPFVLVCPEFFGDNMHWSRQRFAKTEDFARVFPTYVPPQSVTLYPKEKREEITYDLMSYYNSVRSMLDNNWKISDISFSLVGYNARDFGYNYIYVDAGSSSNMATLPSKVIAIGQSLIVKTKGSCAPKCNDLDGPPQMEGFKLRNLPAKCRLLLWRKEPESHVKTPDLKIDLVFN